MEVDFLLTSFPKNPLVALLVGLALLYVPSGQDLPGDSQISAGQADSLTQDPSGFSPPLDAGCNRAFAVSTSYSHAKHTAVHRFQVAVLRP